MADRNWEVIRELAAHLRQAERAIAAHGQRWDTLFAQEQMHAHYSGLASSLVPSTERRWTDRPLEGKMAGLAAMVDQLGQRVDRMVEQNDIGAMDHGVYWETALSQQAADASRLQALNDRLDDLQQDHEPDLGHDRNQSQGMGY